MVAKIAVVIPSFRVRNKIMDVLARIPEMVSRVYVVDDRCPEQSGELVQRICADPRVRVLFNETNMGVGGAVMVGYRAAMADGMTVIVKIDGDGQMDPELIPAFVSPILHGEADYTKGNRFFEVESVRSMPVLRMIGNVGLSFITKLSSGYWNLFDPTNGFTAIHTSVVASLPFHKISNGYFFESDMLFRLNTLRAVVVDIPMKAYYADESSSLEIGKQLPVFIVNNVSNTFKRIYYNYFLRNFNFATIELLLSVLLMSFGVIFGVSQWMRGYRESSYASAGTVMLAALPTLIGLQLLLGFIGFEMMNIPSIPLHKRMVNLSD